LSGKVKQPTVYILTCKSKTTLYIGVTSDLKQRIWQHKQGVVDGFSVTYKTYSLVYYEQHLTMEAAITSEKKLKRWRRAWKNELISQFNPTWDDLYDTI
jgi:putative endonuclease